jgi:hypothetical protein
MKAVSAAPPVPLTPAGSASMVRAKLARGFCVPRRYLVTVSVI